ncbi:hypothetical protein SKAU_G00271280 [Synaphobranchus kaupii]|uniref:HMG box domain-containing protein n=1 Tax=Synaphobranchus kaupii TaxID=118154 RepID=A0A9Q1IQL5_SYNKA|nr:hypothetical protein SKAU_G00271280 [Synaphobranchus kaupii]
MVPRPTGRDVLCRKSRKVKRDWNSSWNTRLKEIVSLLPISVPANGRVLTKKETLVHMLQYLDFLQNHIQNLHSRLPPHCLPPNQEREWSGSQRKENSQSEPPLEPDTLPCFQASRKHVCSYPQKRLPLCTEPWGHGPEKRWKLYRAEPSLSNFLIEEEGEALPMWSGRCDWSKPQHVIGQGAWPMQDSNSLMSSLDSAFGLGQLFTLSAHPGETGGCLGSDAPGDPCSDCWDWTASEDSSPSSGVLDSPPGSSWALLLRDYRLDSPVAMDSPPRHGSLLPLQAICGTEESLNLSPSLFTSPAHGLTHLLPQGQELQALFEDVWVTPKSSSPKVSSLPCNSSTEKVSEWEDAVRNRGGQISSQSEGEDFTWTPTQRAPPRRGSHTRRCRKAPRSRPKLKKKCVNGFIMFCRINRKIYLRTHPGTPSTLVTKELANLWHIMPKQDRCVYCVKARRFSRQQNRNVRSLGTEGEGEGEEGVASPLHMLLAHRDLWPGSTWPAQRRNYNLDQPGDEVWAYNPRQRKDRSPKLYSDGLLLHQILDSVSE